VTLCFGLGWLIADYRIFAFTGSLFGSHAILAKLPFHLLPEAGNFLETMVAWVLQPTLEVAGRARLLRLPVANEHLGLALAGLSGYLNAIVAADACWLVARGNLEAERGRSFLGRPALSVLWGWLVPGLGHVREGRKTLGLIVGSGITAIYVAGLYFSDFCGVDRAQLYWWWAGQAGLGGFSLVCTPLLGPLQITHDVATMDLGITLLTLAGLLNIVVLTDVYTLAEQRALAPQATATGDAA
jgi:hypothetical protein